MYQLMRTALRRLCPYTTITTLTSTTPPTITTAAELTGNVAVKVEDPPRHYLRCWWCGSANERDLFCSNCNHVQKPATPNNYFSVFMLSPDYEVNIREVARRRRFMQTILHPDRFSHKSEEEKAISVNYCALLNKAFTTLQGPLSRALHMLKLNGIHIDDGHKLSDANFLMKIADLSEEVEGASCDHELRFLKRKNDAAIADIAKSLAASFRTGKLETARQLTIKMKYYHSLQTRITDLLAQHGIIEL